MNKLLLCEVFRSSRREGMYLYVARDEGLERVPESLMQVFGTPEPALLLKLDPDRKLARANAAEVIAAIEEQGFFLQMPPAVSAETAARRDALAMSAQPKVQSPC